MTLRDILNIASTEDRYPPLVDLTRGLEKALEQAKTLLLAVDTGAQQDINDKNWYDARKEFLTKYPTTWQS